MKGAWRDFYAALVVRRSSITGRGLFTRRAIPARAKIGEYGGEKIGLREARRRARGRRIVAIVELDKFAYDAKGTDNAFHWINHSCDPNTFMRCTATRAEFYARRAIAPGEEVTTDYGESQHDGRLACRCGAANCRGFI